MFRISNTTIFMWGIFMPELVEKFLKVNFRVIILTLIMLVAFDVALQYIILPHYLNPDKGQANSASDAIMAPAVRRMPADDANTLSLWKNQMAKESGFKVVFLGDSVIHGGGVPSERETIPAYFARQMKILMPAREIKVYAFSLPGCTPADTYNILNYISDSKPDLIIYDVNLAWFGSKNIMEHPRLAELASVQEAEAGQTANHEKLTGQDPEKVLGEIITDHWALYRNRVFLNYLWFGNPLKEKVGLRVTKKDADNQAVTRLTENNEVFNPWYTKNFDVLKKTRGKLGYFNLNEKNQHWTMYKKLAADLEQKQIKSVFFMVPRNRTLYSKYNLIDDKILAEKQNHLATAAEQHGVKVYDYTFAVDDRYFTDSVHLMAPGNQMIAEHLAWDIVESGIIE